MLTRMFADGSWVRGCVRNLRGNTEVPSAETAPGDHCPSPGDELVSLALGRRIFSGARNCVSSGKSQTSPSPVKWLVMTSSPRGAKVINQK